MELPKRKSLRCKGYDYKTIGYYFVTICVKSKEKLLCDIIRNERDYANIWNYIEQNPLRWKSDCFFTD